MSLFASTVSSALLVAALAIPIPQSGPESFDIVATATPKAGAAAGAVTVPMVLKLDRYSPDYERTKMTDGLKYGGYPGFLKALRAAPQIGTLEAAGQTWVVRWAHSVANDKGRTVSIVTDQPVFFVGGGRKGAKSTAGYEVAVMQLVLDKAGTGEGTMAAAARVKPGGETGVVIDNYAETPLKLTAKPRPAQ